LLSLSFSFCSFLVDAAFVAPAVVSVHTTAIINGISVAKGNNPPSFSLAFNCLTFDIFLKTCKTVYYIF